MNKKNEIYDVSAELAKEFGEIGTKKREEATAKAWEEYKLTMELTKALGCIPIEDLITEDFGERGTAEREDFENS
ncbi:MAG: hypothetical protein LUE99_06510 [Bacteroides sp.]|nr:hypothetical protein [Bacteroides sp.]